MKIAFALGSNKPNMSSPETAAFYNQKMHQNAFSAGALSHTGRVDGRAFPLAELTGRQLG